MFGTMSRRCSWSMRALIVVLLAAIFPLAAALPAGAQQSNCGVRFVEDGSAVLTFSGEAVGTRAHLRNQDGWIANVTGLATYRDQGGAGNDYHVVVNGKSRVDCTASTAGVDFTCSHMNIDGDAVLHFWGEDVGPTTAAVFQDGEWHARVTGDSEYVSAGAASESFTVWLNDTRQSVDCDASVHRGYQCTSVAQGADAELFFWGYQATRTSANLRDFSGWLATVTGQTSYTAAGGAGQSHYVKLHNLTTSVACDTTVPTSYSCSVATQGDNAVLRFEGADVSSGTSANLLQDGTWVKKVKGLSNATINGGADSEYIVKLNGRRTAVACGADEEPAGNRPVGQSGDWVIDFEDHFNGTELDLEFWEPVWYDNGGFQRPVNSREDACYHEKQVEVSGGFLRLSVSAETDPECVTKSGEPASLVGAQITTRNSWDNDRYTTTEGYFEARMFLPSSNGDLHNWPGYWINGRNWPSQGEIDVIEGLRERQPCASFHWEGDDGSHQHQKMCPEPAWDEPGGWHIFAADWQQGSVTFYYDGVEIGSAPAGTVTNEPHFMSLQYTANDEWGTPVLDTMLVDYVRVWKRN